MNATECPGPRHSRTLPRRALPDPPNGQLIALDLFVPIAAGACDRGGRAGRQPRADSARGLRWRGGRRRRLWTAAAGRPERRCRGCCGRDGRRREGMVTRAHARARRGADWAGAAGRGRRPLQVARRRRTPQSEAQIEGHHFNWPRLARCWIPLSSVLRCATWRRCSDISRAPSSYVSLQRIDTLLRTPDAVRKGADALDRCSLPSERALDWPRTDDAHSCRGADGG